MRWEWQDAALHFDGGHAFRFKFFGGEIIGLPRIDLCAAGENVERREIIFRPCVDREMRFGDHDDAGDSVGVKRVKHDIDDARLRVFGGFNHNGFDFMHIIKDFGIAVVEFD
jgi:hypothetical protein